MVDDATLCRACLLHIVQSYSVHMGVFNFVVKSDKCIMYWLKAEKWGTRYGMYSCLVKTDTVKVALCIVCNTLYSGVLKSGVLR